MFDLLPTAYILTIFPMLMIFAAVGDIISMKITNHLVLLVVASFYVGAILIGMPLETILVHTAVGIGFFLLGFILHIIGISGGGDIKLLSAILLWVGPYHADYLILFTLLYGGAVVILSLWLKNIPMNHFMLKNSAWMRTIASDGKFVPYGIAICAGALTTYTNTIWFEKLNDLPIS